MIVRFDDIKLDSYGRLERPTLFIHTLTGEPICPVSNFYDLDVEFRFNDVSEISFQIPDRYIDGTEVVHNDSYDEIRGFRMLRMEPFGAFIIQNPQITDNGMAKVKSVTCYSLEYELNYKNMPPLDTTYMFYDPTGESKDTIMNIILEKVPNWKIGHVDTNVATRYRTFDNNGESIYQFMIGTLQESYSCVFLFDTDNRTINVYDSSNVVKNVPLFLSTKNLVKDLQAEELADEIVTCLSVYGANDVSISSVNPIGSDKIYNLDYFVEIGDIPNELAAKWKKWKKDYEIYQGVFSDVFSQYFTTQVLLNNELAILTGLEEELEALEHVLDAMQTDTGGDHATEIAETKTEIVQKTAEVNNQQAKVDTQNDKLEALYNSLDQIYGFCAFDKYFTVDELKTLNLYFKEDSIQEATYVVSYVNDEPSSCNAISSSNPITITIDKGDLYRSDEYTDLTQDNINELDLPPAELTELQNIINGVSAEHLNNYFFKINLGVITVADANKTLDIAGTVVNSTLSYSKTVNANGNYDCVVSFYINEPKSQSEEFLGATNVLMVISGEMTAFQYNNIIDSDTADTMSFNLVGGVMTLTFDSTIYQRQNTIQDLFNYGTETLGKLAYPSYNFSIDSANFMTLPEFDHFKKDIQLGRSMNIEFKDGVFLQPIFIGLSMSFDDVTQFTLEFSDKFNSSNPEFPLADVIGKSAQTSANLDANKFSYTSFENSNIKNDVENIISSALDISKKNIINSKDQSLLIDDGGIHLRKLIDKVNNRFDPCEVRLTNNQIVFTDDAWETAGLAIGKLTVNTDGIDRDFMGIVAQNLIGQVIVGNKLTIEATGVDQVTGQPNVTHFRVDGSGAYLGNASFAIQGKPRDTLSRAVIEGNKILLDPNYGIIAGDNSIFSIGSDGVVANFIDETGNVVYDDTGVMPAGSSLYFDIDTGRLSIRGDVYADNGYFKGKVEATSGVFKGMLDIGDNFKVDENGIMTCKGANVEGTITATDGEFTGIIHATDGEFSGDITANSLVVNNGATVSGLEVGKNVTMGPDAVISWGQLPSNVASSSDVDQVQSNLNSVADDMLTSADVTVITQGAIQTGDLHLGGNIYRIVEGDYWWQSSEHLLFGINGYNNLQVGSPSEKANYEDMNLYSKGRIYFMPGGATVNKETDSTGGWTAILRYNSDTDRGLSVRGNVSCTGNMYISSKRVLTTDDLSESGDTPVINNGHFHSGKTLKCVGVTPMEANGTTAHDTFTIDATLVSKRVRPSSNNLVSCGADNYRWSTVYTNAMDVSGKITNSGIAEGTADSYQVVVCGSTGIFYKSKVTLKSLSTGTAVFG